DLEKQLKNDPTNEALKQQIAQIRNTVTELAKLTGAGGALLIGGDAETMQIAMGTAQNAAVNNYLNHAELKLRDQARQACDAGNPSACQTVKSLDQLSASRNATIRSGVTSATEAQAGEILQNMQTTMQGLTGYRGELQTQLDATSDPSQRASLQNQINQVDNNMKQVAALGKDYLAQQYQNTGNPLYQSAFAQLSEATSGNDLADAMASVMGVQLARLPTRTPSTNPSAATVASQSSIDLAAIQRVRVEHNINAGVNGGVTEVTLPGMDRPVRQINTDFPPNQAVIDAANSPQMQAWIKNTNCIDCSEIAPKLLQAAGGKGQILEVQPTKPGTLNVFENGRMEQGQSYHQVYTDGKYVYDPRLSSQPIPKGDWEQHIRNINPGGVNISNDLKGSQ
ncbi:MAG: hypothetical protein K0M73_06455, partial [Hydrogenophaga sp.]|nr:hypothetical protein [Hydrogenophaga sp.]